MNCKRIDEYHKGGCHFFGKLAVVDYLDDLKADPKFGTFGACLTIDYLERARAIVAERYENTEELLSIPELVVRIL